MAIVISREKAKAAGLRRYFTGKPCRHGHVDERYVSNEGCVICAKIEPRRIRRWTRLHGQH